MIDCVSVHKPIEMINHAIEPVRFRTPPHFRHSLSPLYVPSTRRFGLNRREASRRDRAFLCFSHGSRSAELIVRGGSGVGPTPRLKQIYERSFTHDRADVACSLSPFCEAHSTSHSDSAVDLACLILRGNGLSF